MAETVAASQEGVVLADSAEGRVGASAAVLRAGIAGECCQVLESSQQACRVA